MAKGGTATRHNNAEKVVPFKRNISSEFCSLASFELDVSDISVSAPHVISSGTTHQLHAVPSQVIDNTPSFSFAILAKILFSFFFLRNIDPGYETINNIVS